MTRRDEQGRTYAEHIRKGMLFWMIMLSVAMLMGCFLWLGFEQESNADGRYVPATADKSGKVTPGHLIYD